MSTPTAHSIGRPDIEGDRRRLWDVLVNGGIAIVPSDLGYGFWTASAEATQRILQTKQRGEHKRQGMIMGRTLSTEIHVLDQRKRDIIDCVTQDYDLPLGVIATFRPEHPFMQKIDSYLMKVGTARGMTSSAMNAGGPFHAHIAELSRQHLLPIFGSSANITGKGTKFRVQDIEPEVLAIADLVLDYGLRRAHSYLISSTQINFETMEVSRIGAYYEIISDVLKRHFDMDLPPDPGRAVNRSGHLQEFALAGLNEQH